MTAAQLLVKCLENEGVEYIFGLPGEENIDVMDALLDSKIKFGFDFRCAEPRTTKRALCRCRGLGVCYRVPHFIGRDNRSQRIMK